MAKNEATAKEFAATMWGGALADAHIADERTRQEVAADLQPGKAEGEPDR